MNGDLYFVLACEGGHTRLFDHIFEKGPVHHNGYPEDMESQFRRDTNKAYLLSLAVGAAFRFGMSPQKFLNMDQDMAIQHTTSSSLTCWRFIVYY